MKIFALSSATLVSSDTPVLKEIINSHEEVLVLHSSSVDAGKKSRIYRNDPQLFTNKYAIYLYKNKNICIFFLNGFQDSRIEEIAKNIIRIGELFTPQYYPSLDNFWKKLIINSISKEDTLDLFKLKVALIQSGWR